MQRSQIAPLILGALVFIAIALGLTVTGGPGTGRLEKRDKVRADDIRRITRFYVPCLADEANGSLPNNLIEEEICLANYGTIRLVDPYSGSPYRYERVTNKLYRVCASFDLPELVTPYRFGGLEFDPTTGCLANSYTPTLSTGRE